MQYNWSPIGLGSGDKSAPKAAAPSPALGLLGNPGSDAAKLLHGMSDYCVYRVCIRFYVLCVFVYRYLYECGCG